MTSSKFTSGIFFSYYWYVDDKEKEITSIRAYGLDENNKNICLRIDDFTPYIYLELPVKTTNGSNIDWKSKAQSLGDRLDDILKEQKPIKKKLQYKHKLYGAEIDKDNNKKVFPYLLCSFSNKTDYKNLFYILKKPIYVLGLGQIKLKMHEQDASEILQLVSCRDIPTAGWIKFKGKEVIGDEKLTICDKEYYVGYQQLNKFDKNILACPKIMGFDIEVNSTNPSAMPNSSKPGDKIFQISCVFSREGESEDKYDNYLLTLGEVDPELLGDNVNAYMFESEADLLEGFTELVREQNPNIIVGYNILKFDIQYMIDRAKSSATHFCFNEFAKLGFHKDNISNQEKIKWSSSAFKNQEFDYLDAEGRVFVDLLPLIQRDYKFNNYQLKTVSKELLKDTKDDLSPKGIFKCYRIGIQKEKDGSYSKKAIKAMSICGRYCLKDSILVVKLMEKLQAWVGLAEMAKTTNISIFDVFTQGQQKKVYSQIYKYCMYQNIVVEKDAYVTKENERYVGAHVFPPVPGNYEHVLPFDFCLSGDTLVNLSSGLSRRIDMFDKNNLVIGFNEESKGFENYSFINGLQKKGIRETVKIYFQDGSSIVATPEHKFMLENGEWCQAKDLKNKYVKAGIKFPEDKMCDLEKDWILEVEGCILNMKNDEDRDKSLAFARMIGYILADGSIYESTCNRGYTRKYVEACFGTMYDALSFKRDINLFNKIDVSIRKRDGNGNKNREMKGTTLSISMPANLSKMFHSLEDIIVGKRATQEMKLPKFILDDNCPLSIIREFLGGLFGGDGSSCSLTSRDTLNNISFKWTTTEQYISSMNNTLINIKNLLEKLEIYETSILKPIKINYTNKTIKPYDYLINPRYDIKINLLLNNTIVFMRNIGFRYCINKQYKTYLVSMYLDMKNITKHQRIKILNRSNKLIDINITNVFSRKKNNMNFSDCLDIARKELLQNEPALYSISLSSSYDLTYDRHERLRHPYKPRVYSLHKKKFPSPTEYFKDINVLEYFDFDNYLIKTDDISIPSFRQKVIDVREHDSIEVFDIEVDKVHNFLANGITVSNCSLYPSTIIAYNIDYSSWVTDPSIPDEKCNVFKWRDCISCIVGNSNITVNNFGINIEDLQDNNNLILSHSEKTNLLEYKNQINFFNQGEKECIELIFEDGTTLKCTPDHKIMTSKNEWIEAQNIILHETKIKKSIVYPVTNFKKYISKFNLRCGDLFLNMDNPFEVERFAKFSRLFGMLYTDGSIEKNSATIYCGDIIDAESVIKDIYDVCGVKTDYRFFDRKGESATYFHITLPYKFHNSYLYNLGDGYGERMNRNSKLPSFILDKNCPSILKREFIAGMFGGDGAAPKYCKKTKTYRNISFYKSKNFEYIENLNQFLESLQKILLEDFNIRSHLNGPYEKKDAKDCYTTNLHIDVNDIIKFRDEIGFRYCTYKSFKLEVLCSYKNLNNNVFDQRERSYEIIRKLHNTMRWKDAVVEGHKIIRKTEIIYNEHYALPNVQSVIDSTRRPRDGNKKTFWSTKFPSFEQYLTNLNVYKYFVDDNKNKESSIYCMSRLNIDDIPYYELKIIGIRNIGIHSVYDIEVEDNHSFLANGVVVHNCKHDPKVIKYNELSKHIDSEKEIIKKLREERDSKFNKHIKQKYIDQINKKIEELKPYTSERSDIKKTISKTPMCEERYYRFLKEPKGVIPTILQNLLDARKNTRKQIKENQKLVGGVNDPKKIRDIDDLNKVLDKRQLAYKISANSMYGILGVKKGLLPFMPGAMCLQGDSLISYSYGFTRKIKDLTHTNFLWTYNNGQLISNGNGLIYNGKREIVKITLTDGRTIKCTPDHKIMTPNGWIEAGKLLSKHNWDGTTFRTNDEYSKVIVGFELPEDIIGDDEKNWKLLDYTMDTSNNREKTLAFCRVLGFILADGNISSYFGKNNNKLFSSKVCLGTLLDANIFVNDIKLLTEQQPKINSSESVEIKGKVFTIHIPKILLDKILLLNGIVIGKRSHQPNTLPSFLFEINCPLSVIREFLGGLFGGNGTSPSLSVSHPSFSPIQLGWTTIEKYKNDMNNTMNNLIILLSKFDINFWLSTPKLARIKNFLIPKDIKENPRWEYVINTNSCNSLLFAQKIGFRYCTDKNNKLSVAASYQRYSDNIRKQHVDCVLRTSEMYDLNNKKITIKDCLIKSREELYKNEIPLHEHISLSKSSEINNHRSRPRSLKDYKLLQKYFPTAKEYVKLVGCDNWFLEKKGCKKVYSMDRKDIVSPCIYLDVIDVRYDGVEDVYDIIDVPNHSFLANGIVVHNCTTYMGRTNIEIVADTITKKYGGKLVYGDMIED